MDSVYQFSSALTVSLAVVLGMALSGCATSNQQPHGGSLQGPASDTRAASSEDFSRITGTLQPVPALDIDRFMGDWVVWANIPYWAEKGAHGSIERYRKREDGRIATDFFYRKGAPEGPLKHVTSVAKVTNHPSNAVWQVIFFGFIKIPYVVIALDPDYQWAVIGHPDRKLGWILSRNRNLPEATVSFIMAQVKSQGYDPQQFVRVPAGLSPIPPKSGVGTDE